MRKNCVVVLVLSFLSLFCTSANSQSTNNSGTSGTNATGASMPAPYDGLHEQINLSNGNLSITVPLLSLPGRGDNDLVIALEHDSATYQLRSHFEYQTTQWNAFWSKVSSYPHIWGNWRLAIPTLIVTNEQDGISSIPNDVGSPPQPYFCDHFMIQDADGSRLSFQNLENCYYQQSQTGPLGPVITHLTYTTADGSGFAKLDTTNPNDIVLTKRNGTQIHFNRSANSFQGDVSAESVYTYTKIVDRNGNRINLAASLSGFVFTDTLGRQVTVDSTGVTFPDSSNLVTGTSHIGFSGSSNSNGSPLSLSAAQCTDPNGSGLAQGMEPGTYSVNAGGFNYVVTYPDNSTLTMVHDALGSLTAIIYPQGGYKRFVYSNYSFKSATGVKCQNTDSREVTHKYECVSGSCGCSNSSSAQACGGEYETRYTPVVNSAGPGQQGPSGNAQNTLE